MNIKVCVGSSCHLKGSYDVIEAFKAVLKKYDVEDVVDLQASFCLGHCAKGVTVSCEEREPSGLPTVAPEGYPPRGVVAPSMCVVNGGCTIGGRSWYQNIIMMHPVGMHS